MPALFPASPVPAVPIKPDRIPDDARPLTPAELAILTWLLQHANPPAEDLLDQLPGALASPGCTCGCPSVIIHVPVDAPRVNVGRSPFAEARAYVGLDMVGVLLFQAGGHLTYLEFHDLSDIPHPYGLPDPATLELLTWPERPDDT